MAGRAAAYWVATLVFCALMAYDAFAYLSGDPKMARAMAGLGYPPYFSTILGVAKVLGVIVLLLPDAPRIKEWAYAGFTFTLIGACVSHLETGQHREALMPLLALAIMAISYVLRPPLRRILEAAALVR